MHFLPAAYAPHLREIAQAGSLRAGAGHSRAGRKIISVDLAPAPPRASALASATSRPDVRLGRRQRLHQRGNFCCRVRGVTF